MASQSPSPKNRVKRLSTAVEKTVDKLSRSVSVTSPSSPSSSSRRVFTSISRKSRAEGMSGCSSSHTHIQILQFPCLPPHLNCRQARTLPSSDPRHRRFARHCIVRSGARDRYVPKSVISGFFIINLCRCGLVHKLSYKPYRPYLG